MPTWADCSVADTRQTRDVSRAVYMLLRRLRLGGKPPPDVVEVGTDSELTPEEFCLVVERDGHPWRHAGGGRWSVVRISYSGELVPPDTLPVADLGYPLDCHLDDSVPPSAWIPGTGRRWTDKPAPVRDATLLRTLLGSAGPEHAVGLLASIPRAGSPYARPSAVNGKLGFPAWLGPFASTEEPGRVVPAGVTDQAAELVSSGPDALWAGIPTEADEVAAIFASTVLGAPFPAPVVRVGGLLGPFDCESDGYGKICIAHDGIRFGFTGTLRCDLGVSAFVTIGRHSNTFPHYGRIPETTYVFEIKAPRISVWSNEPSVLSDDELLRIKKWAGTDFAIPVISNEMPALAIALRDDGAAHLVSVTSLSPRAHSDGFQYAGRLCIGTGADGAPLRPFLALRQHDDFVLLCARQQDHTVVTVVRATRSASLWARRNAALDPVGRGPPVHGVAAMCAVAAGNGSARSLSVLLDATDALRDTATPTVTAALRSLVARFQPERVVCVVRPGQEDRGVDAVIPGLSGLLHALHVAGQCPAATTTSESDTNFPPPASAVLWLFASPAAYQRRVAADVLDGGRSQVPVEFFDGSRCVQHGPLAFPLIDASGAERQALPTAAYERCDVRVLVRRADPDAVVGFVLRGHAPPCYALGLTTEDMRAFLLACPGVERVECVYATAGVAVRGPPPAKEPRGVAGVVTVLVASGAGVIIDLGQAQDFGPADPRDPDAAYAIVDTIPDSDDNRERLARTLGCTPAALHLFR